MPLFAALLIILGVDSSNAACLGLGGDERLQNHCLLNTYSGRAIDYRTASLIDRRLRLAGSSLGLGIPSDETFSNYQSSYSTSFIMGYDSNINGGHPAKPLVVGNFTFNTDPELDLISGIFVGPTAQLGGRAIYGERKYLSYGVNGSYSFSTSTSDNIATINAHGCSLNHAVASWFVDACANHYRSQKTLATSLSNNFTFTVSNIFTTSSYNNQVKFGINHLRTKAYKHNQLLLSFDTIHPRGRFSSISLKIGKPVPEELFERVSVQGKVVFLVTNKPLTLTGKITESAGGLVFGAVRDDSSISLGLSYVVWPKLKVEFGYSYTDSTLDYFDSVTPTLGLQFVATEF